MKPLVSVAFEVTNDNYAGDCVDNLSALAEGVEHAIRVAYPDCMVRRLDPDEGVDADRGEHWWS